MKGVRLERVQEEIRRELGEILQRRTRDPRLAWVSVTRVEVSADLMHARVHVSALGDEGALRESLRALVKASPFLRNELGRGLKLRRVPEIQFLPDPGIRYSVHMSQLLRELGVEPAAPGAGASAAGQREQGDPGGREHGGTVAGDEGDGADEDDPAGGDDPWKR